MSQSTQDASAAKEHALPEPCPCRELVETVRKFLGVSAAARQHLTNSRVEFLKAVREMLDARIAHLSSTQAAKGTKVAVE